MNLVRGVWTCPICNWEWRHADGRPFASSIPVLHECPAAVSRGLGDTVAKVAHRLGIPKCGGCRRRQELLNRIMPFR